MEGRLRSPQAQTPSTATRPSHTSLIELRELLGRINDHVSGIQEVMCSLTGELFDDPHPTAADTVPHNREGVEPGGLYGSIQSMAFILERKVYGLGRHVSWMGQVLVQNVQDGPELAKLQEESRLAQRRLDRAAVADDDQGYEPDV